MTLHSRPDVTAPLDSAPEAIGGEGSPDAALIAALTPQTCLREAVLPLRDARGRPLVLAADPLRWRHRRSALLQRFAPRDALSWATSPVRHAPRAEVQARVAAEARAALTHAASHRVPAAESFRTWRGTPARRLAVLLAALALVAAITALAPGAVMAMLLGWAAFTLMVSAGLKTAAYLAPARPASAQGDVAPAPAPEPETLPVISVLVPLFREREIASHLIRRLSLLSYPQDRLEVVLVLEEKDRLTRDTIAAIDLPAWMRVIEVPEGRPTTKPRAMNYALDFCRGDIIGIWDAEDAPDPDQLLHVARRFAAAPPDVACLQGILDYYNPRQNWLARCFTIEYAAWFRLMLPGMCRLGLAIPLGGTTLFFRRAALERLGGWDAHNVTEDADLGFRLARHGYRTEMIGTVTGEEANCHLLAWIKQRSRWLKGYMMTYLVHMRRPGLLLRQLGPRRFWGFQAHFVSALSQVLLAPLLWSFWLIPLGLEHPFEALLPGWALVTLAAMFLLAEVVNILIAGAAVLPRSHRHLLPWVPTMHFYYPLAVLGAYKAVAELLFAPFYWDKTRHGHSLARATDPDGGTAGAATPDNPDPAEGRGPPTRPRRASAA